MRLKICKAQAKRYNVSSSFGSASGSSSNQSHITITIPLITQNTPENSDAERRRTKALKALKERLKKPGEDEEQLKSATADWNIDPLPSSSTSIPSVDASAATTSAASAATPGVSSAVLASSSSVVVNETK